MMDLVSLKLKNSGYGPEMLEASPDYFANMYLKLRQELNITSGFIKKVLRNVGCTL